MSAPDTPASGPYYRFTLPVIGMIWAQTKSGVIGDHGSMPWHVPEDMAQFKRVTTGHPVIMGRRTWESFPPQFRPLPGRTNIVITSQENWGRTPAASGAVVVHSLQDALARAQDSPGSDEVWIIGGGQVYAAGLEYANVAAMTILDTDVGGDTHAPVLGPEWTLLDSAPERGWQTSRTGTGYRFTLWGKSPDPLASAD